MKSFTKHAVSLIANLAGCAFTITRSLSRSRSGGWLPMLTIFALSGCAGLSHVDDPVARSIDHAARATSTDVAFITLNRLIPSFGGLYRGPKGDVRVALTDASAEPAARPLIEAYLRTRQLIQGNVDEIISISFESAQQTWFDLSAYRDGLVDVLSLPKVVYLDVDEACNCVTVAVENMEAKPAVEQFVKKAGVPTGVVHIVQHDKLVFAQSLRDQFRPTKGGVRIKFNSVLSFGGSCTATAVARRGSVLGLITNSHCTRNIGGVEGTEIYQAGTIPFGFDFVATELVDPPWTAAVPGCPAGRLCRLSDSAFAAFANPADGAIGKIALPAAMCGNTPCSLQMNNPSDDLTIIGTGASPLQGDLLGKIGQTTGFTRGAVTLACVMANVAARSLFDPTNLTLPCQNFVGAALDQGDSGAPVFSLLQGNRAVLTGIAWGMSVSTASPEFVFSSIGAVASELGAISVFVPPSGGGGNQPPLGGGSGNEPPPEEGCRLERNDCMREVATRGGPRPQQCVAQFPECNP